MYMCYKKIFDSLDLMGGANQLDPELNNERAIGLHQASNISSSFMIPLTVI